MRTTAQLNQWVAQGHRLLAEVSVIGWSGTRIRPTLGTLAVLEGRIRVDRWANFRRSIDLAVVVEDPSWLPLTPSAPLAPYGNELRVRMGLVDPTATGGSELVDVGIFGIDTAVIADKGDEQIVKLRGTERSKRIARAGFISPWPTVAGEDYKSAILRLLDWAFPGCPSAIASDGRPCPGLVWEPTRANPWSAIGDLAKGMAAEAFVDVDGTVVVRSAASAATVPAWSFKDGDNSTAVSIEPAMDTEEGYNGVVVTGESSGGDPVWAVRWDERIGSPTHWQGPYGKRPKYIQSNTVKDDASAADLAANELALLLGTSEKISISAIPHPGLDAGDLISVTKAGLLDDERYVVDSIDLPLGPDLATISARKWGT